MAYKLHLRRWVRRSGFFLFTTAAATHQAAAAHAADTALLQKTQGLSHTLQGLVGPSINGPAGPSFFQWRGHCHSASSSSSSAPSADEKEYNGEEGEEIGFMTAKKRVMQAGPHQLARSHSCSSLQGRAQLLPSFIKSLFHHTNSHSHVDHIRHSPSYTGVGEQAAAAAERNTEARSSRCSRSWSSSSLHTRQQMRKLPEKASSFSGSRSGEDHAGAMMSRGKRAPKGHVAVYVEAGTERRVVPIAYLSHPEFQNLLERAQSEFGFRQRGGLLIPCSLSELQDTLRSIHCDKYSPSCVL